MELTVTGLQASNAFYYYSDVETAWRFYQDTLGFETVVDYGFAKIMRVAQSSYLTLVDAASGMHSVEEPKSVTLAIVTEQVAGWYDYLTAAGVSIHKSYTPRAGSNHDGFVALDPEGYFLEFERFNLHPENSVLLPLLSELKPVYARVGTRPQELGIQATVLWLYHRDLASMQQFYEGLLGVELLVDQGWAKVYQIAGSGFVGLVDGEQGLHPTAEQKAVTVSFFTEDVEAWFERAAAWPNFELRTPEITTESGRVRIFVGYDPEGYFLEWDTFLDFEENKALLRYLNDVEPDAVSLQGHPLYSAQPSEQVLENYQKYKAAYEADPLAVDNIIWFGRFTAYKGDHKGAIALYSDGLSNFPDDPRLYRHRGHKYITMRAFDPAIKDFERAAKLIEGTPDQVEPDGMPNARNIPVTTLHGNIWYHLGLAHYLKHDMPNALHAYERCLATGNGPDNMVSASHWLYMILRRMGREKEANDILLSITASLDVIENIEYHKICLFYKGELSIEDITGNEEHSVPGNDGISYAIGNWHVYNGDKEKARSIFETILATGSWNSFGYIAAEAHLAEI